MINRLRTSSRSLPFRIAALLAITLLPIGLISVTQTLLISRAEDVQARAGLLALTAEAASGEEAQIRTALGAANAIASIVPGLAVSPGQCSTAMADLLDKSAIFSFAGYVDDQGQVVCGSDGAGMNIAHRANFRMMQENPVTRVSIVLDAPVSKTAVVVTMVPVLRADGAFNGYVAVSLPHRQLLHQAGDAGERNLTDLITFNAAGDILTADSGLESATSYLPQDRSLPDLVRDGKTAFVASDATGAEHVYAFVPIIQGAVYALGVWEKKQGSLLWRRANMAGSLLFPVSMWLASLAVAFFAVQRMVIRPTRALRARMLQFMRSRRVVPMANDGTLPLELVEMNETWERMAESVLRDEAELENNLHAQKVLLKEVHHRVKNNLQLIASILNMKMRKSATPAIRTALGDIHSRVMSLARVHQQLYETSTSEQVRADELLDTLVTQIQRGAGAPIAKLRFNRSFQPVTVYPDQAVPLSLAVSELMTNALKYMGHDAKGEARLDVRLWLEKPAAGAVAEAGPSGTLPDEKGEAEGNAKGAGNDEGGAEIAWFEIANTLRDPATMAPDHSADLAPGTGLGEKLIRAFVQQMGGRMETETTGGTYRVRLRFPVAGFQPMPE